jgi:hypothetical protein
VPLLTNADRAIIEASKLRDYLLNPANENTGGKWAIFASLGYTRANWQLLEVDLRQQHLTQEAKDAGDNLYGVKHEIVAVLRGAQKKRYHKVILAVRLWVGGAAVPNRVLIRHEAQIQNV